METKAQKRVSIAKDVIKQLKAGIYVSPRGVYLNTIDVDKKKLDSINKKILKNELEMIDTKSIIPMIKKCQVCTKGALFVSKVAKYNKHNTFVYTNPIVFYESTLYNQKHLSVLNNEDDNFICNGLLDIFTQKQLDLISAF